MSIVPVKRRATKRREEFCEDAQRWLSVRRAAVLSSKNADELAALWAEYGDPELTEWDAAAQMPRARKSG
jgi:hypothetical protein